MLRRFSLPFFLHFCCCFAIVVLWWRFDQCFHYCNCRYPSVSFSVVFCIIVDPVFFLLWSCHSCPSQFSLESCCFRYLAVPLLSPELRTMLHKLKSFFLFLLFRLFYSFRDFAAGLILKFVAITVAVKLLLCLVYTSDFRNYPSYHDQVDSILHFHGSVEN